MVPRIGTSLLLLAAIALAQHAVAQITPLAPATHSSNYSAMAIVKVEMAGSSRTSGYTSPPAYNDYTGQAPFELTPGDSYQIKVTRGSYSSVKRHAFIDWNNDGDFDDANEEIGTDGTSSSNTILDWVKSFTCPVGTPAGLKRMRVRLHYYYYAYSSYQSYFTPYYNTLYGETEDYAVEVLGTTPPVMTPKTLKSTYANVAFEDYVEATDGKAPYTYAINKISNASWVNLDENTGKVFGNPGSLDGGTTAVFEITATDDSNLTSDPVQYTVTVNNPLSLPYTDDMSGAKIANYLLKSGTGAYMDIRPEAGETGTGLLLAGSGTGSWPLSPASNQANLDVLNNPAKWAGGASPDASAFNSQATFYVSAPVLNRLAVQFDYKITNDALLADADDFTNFVIEYTEDGKNWLRGVGQNANAQNFYRDETSSFVRENSILNLSGTQTQVGVRISALVRNRYNTSDKTFISIDNLNVFVPVQILTSGELPSAQETVPYPPVILDLFGGMQPYTVDFDPANAPPASYNLMVEYDNDLAAWVLRSPANLGPNVGSTGLHSFKILANDANNVPQSKTFSLAINPVPSPLTFTTTALPSTAVDTLYSQQVSVSGGVPFVGPNPYLFSITSTSAGWMSIDANTGTISGTVPAADLGVTHQVTVRVEDRIGSSKEATFSIAVVDSLEV
ncbi:MAG: hypothetical protein KDB07_05050, partial [Planctomycetes bacterium]|nr:hypothetical protein [Planctomycetota bacterium]